MSADKPGTRERVIEGVMLTVIGVSDTHLYYAKSAPYGIQSGTVVYGFDLSAKTSKELLHLNSGGGYPDL